MARYATFCETCKQIYFSTWENKKCPKCGNTGFQSKVEEPTYNRLSNDQKKKVFEEIELKIREKELVKIKDEEAEKAKRSYLHTIQSIIITTVDLKHDYVIKGLVFYQINDVTDLILKKTKEYQSAIDEWKKNGFGSDDSTSSLEVLASFGELLGGNNKGVSLVGSAHGLIDSAFFIAMQELKIRANKMGANAIIGFRTEPSFEPVINSPHFFLTVYGTAVDVIGY